MGQVGERSQWLFAALPSTRSVAGAFHIGSDWGRLTGKPEVEISRWDLNFRVADRPEARTTGDSDCVERS
jgi:hypothetical protein